MGGSQTVGRWLGGYKRRGKRGVVFIIERWIDGTRYHVSTKCRTERAALDQLAIFESDPKNYRPNRKRVRDSAAPARGASITPELTADYENWMRTRDDPATEEHIHKHAACLDDWMRLYRRRPIADVALWEIADFLDTGGKNRAPLKNRAMRIQALKSYCAWLRKTKFLLTRAQDPTIDLELPARRATKDARQVAVEPERILKILPHLPADARDAVILRLGTGWHAIEVRRFAVEGEIRYTPGKFIYLARGESAEKIPLLATLHVRQKIGVTTNTPIIYPEHLKAAERIRESGYVPSQTTMQRYVRAACKTVGVPYFWNWHLRHSVVSYASEEGADLEVTSAFIDHVGINTDRRHYRQIPLPKKAVPVLRVLDGGKEKAG
jgi:hypothetical protein